MSIPFSHFFTKINSISPDSDIFLQRLTTIALMPKTLYYNGTLPQNVVYDPENQRQSRASDTSREAKNRPKTVAIVGSRKNTSYGEKIAYELAFELAKRNIIVVSGLAFGTDSIAHRGAVDAGGITIGILGTPIGTIYPKSHEKLAERMLELGGAIISEIPENGQYHFKTSFLRRNRLISGLSDIIIIVEAAEKSGSLNTAMHAIEQGRELLAVPGNITSPLSQGCNKLIKQGAMPYTGISDVLDLLFPPSPKTKRKKSQLLTGDNDIETSILRALGDGATDGEDIIEIANLGISEFNQAISILEIKGRVFSQGANHWCLK